MRSRLAILLLSACCHLFLEGCSMISARQLFMGGGAGGGIILPDGAIALDYVVSAGANGVGTGIVPSSGTDLYCLAEPTPTTVICIFGAGGSWIGHQTSYVLTSNNGSTGMSAPSGVMSEYSIVGGKICLNGTASSVTSAIIGKTSVLAYGGYNTGGSFAWLGKMGRFWAIRDGEKIADFIPCLHNGNYGFCDIVTQSFFAEGRYSNGGNLS